MEKSGEVPSGPAVVLAGTSVERGKLVVLVVLAVAGLDGGRYPLRVFLLAWCVVCGGGSVWCLVEGSCSRTVAGAGKKSSRREWAKARR